MQYLHSVTKQSPKIEGMRIYTFLKTLIEVRKTSEPMAKMGCMPVLKLIITRRVKFQILA